MQRSFARLLNATALVLGLIAGPLLMSASGDEAHNFPTTTPRPKSDFYD